MQQKVFVSAVSEEKTSRKALEQVVAKIKSELGSLCCDLAILFVSEAFRDQKTEHIFAEFRRMVNPRFLIGCNSCGIVADSREVEMKPAITVLAMHMPNVNMQPFYLSPAELEGMATPDDLIGKMDLYPTEQPQFLVLADPYTSDVNKLLSLFNKAYPGLPVAGGLASANVVGTSNWLLLNSDIYREGTVGLALSGDVRFETIVSQGCRPIGAPFIITRCEQNSIYELAGKPALEVLKGIFSKLSTEDQVLARQSLFLGMVMDESKANFERGDFLIRNIMGADHANGTLIVGEQLAIGQTVQFQLRDARASEEDLAIMLAKLPHLEEGKPAGAILVSCCGRGKGLFGITDHDARMIQEKKGPFPTVGFFANGEFGPVENQNYIHGYTASLTLIR